MDILNPKNPVSVVITGLGVDMSWTVDITSAQASRLKRKLQECVEDIRGEIGA